MFAVESPDVAAREFSFAISMSGQPPQDMLGDLVSGLLGHAGCSDDVVPGVVEAVQGAMGAAARTNLASGSLCSVRLSARGGEVQIEVRSGTDLVWQGRQPIPEVVGNDASV